MEKKVEPILTEEGFISSSLVKRMVSVWKPDLVFLVPDKDCRPVDFVNKILASLFPARRPNEDL